MRDINVTRTHHLLLTRRPSVLGVVIRVDGEPKLRLEDTEAVSLLRQLWQEYGVETTEHLLVVSADRPRFNKDPAGHEWVSCTTVR